VRTVTGGQTVLKDAQQEQPDSRPSSGFANQAVIGSVLGGKAVAVVRRWAVINGCLIG